MVAAKRAGYSVTAIDAFADKQTVELADHTIVVDYDQHGFNAAALLAAIKTLDVSQYLGFVYGSGFDAQPELLQQIAQMLPVIGNTPATVHAVKTAASFFSVLGQLHIASPKVYDVLPADWHTSTYLEKFAGGCGGAHISIADTQAEAAANHYYQQYIDGYSVSLLFVADGKEIVVIGFNEQWLSPTAAMPFRYGGAVGNIDLPHALQQSLTDAAQKLTCEFGLLGLNSLDAIVENVVGSIGAQRDVAYVLEVNPRLSATFDLYEPDVNLFNLHVQVSLKQASVSNFALRQVRLPAQPKAHAIVYAEFDAGIPAAFNWPDWAVDTPQYTAQSNHIKVLAGEPVCTVTAHAEHADAAKRLAQSRVNILIKKLTDHHQKTSH